MGPSEGPAGTEVTLTGSGFGTSRGDILRGGRGGAGHPVQRVVGGRDQVPGARGHPGSQAGAGAHGGGDSVPFDFTLTPPSASWYLAEGCTGGDFETWVLVQNPNGAAVTVDLTLMTSSGEQKPAGLQDVTIPGDPATTFNLNSYVTDYNVSTRVEAGGNVVCERAMYGNGRHWAHESIGATSTSSTWYLAEGCTEGDIETWVLVQNPNDTAVTVDLELQSPTGGGAGIAGRDHPAPGPASPSTWATTLTSWDVSTLVDSAGGNVVCERAMYGNGRTWAHDSIGGQAAATAWYLAEGCTAGDFETWVLVQNPGDGSAGQRGPATPDRPGQADPAGLQDVIIAPRTRQSFNLGPVR